ncbi:carboxyl transferase domain-containing protein [Bradyrhizobium ottawaense]
MVRGVRHVRRAPLHRVRHGEDQGAGRWRRHRLGHRQWPQDEGDFFEIAEAFAKNIVTGFGRIAGRTVGFVANQPMVLAGVLDSDASRKASAMPSTSRS